MSCLFDSIGSLFKINPQHLRQAVCNYLEKNEPLIEGLPTNELLAMINPNYVQMMRNDNTWGGGIEIKAMCNMLITNINVHTSGGNVIEFLCEPKSRRTVRIQWNGYHYTPIH